jgi:hypothetical protein
MHYCVHKRSLLDSIFTQTLILQGAFLTSALQAGQWPASRPSGFTCRERAPTTHYTGDWVGPRAALDTGEEKNLSPAGNGTPAHQPVTRHYTESLVQ